LTIGSFLDIILTNKIILSNTMDANEINVWEWDERDSKELDSVPWKAENAQPNYRAESKIESPEKKVSETDAVLELQRRARKKRMPLGATGAKLAATAVALMLVAGSAYYGGYFDKSKNSEPILPTLPTPENSLVIPDLREREDPFLVAEGQLDSNNIIASKPSEESKPAQPQEKQKTESVQTPQEKKIVPELTWIESFNATAGTEVRGPALIEKADGWVRIYSGQTYTMTKDGHVNTYTGNNAGLDAEYARVLKEWEEKQTKKEEKTEDVKPLPELTWTGNYEGFSGTKVEGPALIEKDNGWIKVYPGQTYTMTKNGQVNTYAGNSVGLEVEYARVLKEWIEKQGENKGVQQPKEEKPEAVEQVPELSWTGTYEGFSGTAVKGPALIEKDNGWVKVSPGETYIMKNSGSVNTYIGNVSGLEAEYGRVMKEWTEKQVKNEEIQQPKEEKTETVEQVPELSWTGSYEGLPGTAVKGPALIEKDNGWVKVYPGETFIMQKTGSVNTYEGNVSGLETEYNRVTQN
jgi:hypothetical protein